MTGEDRRCPRCGHSFASDLPSCPKCKGSPGVSPGQPTDVRVTASVTATSTMQTGSLTSPSVRSPTVLPPSLATRFESIGVLGQGGGGSVILSKDRRLGRQVAIKLIGNASPAGLEDFDREGRLLASLEHEHVVRLYDAGVADGVPYLVMEYVRGIPLSSRLARGRPPQTEAIQIALGIAKGIEAAHARDIVHRDLKPANVFLDEHGKAKIADFGLAVLRGPQEAETVSRSGPPSRLLVVGTLGYIAPEVARGEKTWAPVDIYGWGVILYEMLTGQRLFAGTDPRAIVRVQEHGKLKLPSQINPAVSRELDDLVRQSLALDPAARPTATELINAISVWLDRSTRIRRFQGEVEFPVHPYKPLQHLDTSDASLFCGRDSEIEELVSYLESQATRAVFLFGPCGIGKSSLLRAGLVSSLDPAQYDCMVFTSGPDPARILWNTLLGRVQDAEGGIIDESGALKPQPRRLPSLFLRLAKKASKTRVVMIDQLEELITHNPRGSARIGEFFESIQTLVEDQRLDIKIVLSFRSEFRGDFFPLEERLSGFIKSYGLREITETGLVEAIEKPSRVGVYGFSFDKGFCLSLAKDILRVTQACGDTVLPVMQIVSSQLLDRMKAQGLTKIGPSLYEGALGGAEGALRRYVEERLASPEYAHRGAMARQMLAALTIREPTGERFSQAREEEDLLSFPDRTAAQRTLERLVADHLVIRETGKEWNRQIRLASEVVCGLIDAWTLEPDESERAARILVRSYRHWEEHGRKSEDLLAGATLKLVESQWVSLRDITPPEAAFVKESLAKRRVQRIRWAVVSSVGFLTLSGLFYAAFLRPGRLYLSSSPHGAKVRLADLSLGETPLVWGARPGTYKLTLSKAGHETTTVSVKVPAGGEAVYHQGLAYPYGLLAVTSTPPGATCEVTVPSADQSSPTTSGPKVVIQRETPFTGEIPTGTYRLRFFKSGFGSHVLEGVRIGSNRELTQSSVDLERKGGRVVIQGGINGSRVVIQEDRTGAVVHEGVLPEKAPIELSVGRYRIRCSRLSLVSDEKFVDVAKDSSIVVTLSTPWIHHSQYTLAPLRLAVPVMMTPLEEGARQNILAVTVDGDLEAAKMDYSTHWKFPPRSDANRDSQKSLLVPPALADLDGDDLVDPVIACRDGKVRSVNGRTGKLLWTWSGSHPVTHPPVVADVDTDAPTVFVPGEQPTLTVLNGKSGTPLWTCETTGGPATSVIVGDLEGRNVVDIVLGTASGRIIAVSGKTHAPIWTSEAVGTISDTPVLGDLDRDGVLDVIVGTDKGWIKALSGKSGRPLWSTEVSRTAPSTFDLGDLDSDGIPDLVTSTNDGNVHALSGRTGKPLWSAQTGSARVTAPVLGDVNSDGATDTVVGTIEGRLLAFSGRDGHSLWSLAVHAPIEVAPTLSDFFGDGGTSVAIVTARGVLMIVPAQSPVSTWTHSPGSWIYQPISLADLDKDGVLDPILAMDCEVTALSGKTGAPLWRFETDSYLESPASLADLDGDGITDIVVSTYLGAINAVSGKDGHLILTLENGDIEGSVISLGDLDDDGVPDLCIGSQDGTGGLQVHSGRNGRFLWGYKVGGSIYSPPALGDLDGNGKLDVITNAYNGPVYAFEGGTGRVLWKSEKPEYGGTCAIALGKLDGKDHMDAILFSNDATKTTALCGKTGKDLWEFPMAGYPKGSPAVADLDGDGQPDVVIGGQDGNLYAVDGRTGRLKWVFPTRRDLRFPPALTDFDGDGHPDIVAHVPNDYSWAGYGFFWVVSGLTGRLLTACAFLSKPTIPCAFFDLEPTDAPKPTTWLSQRYAVSSPPRKSKSKTFGLLNTCDETSLAVTPILRPPRPVADERVVTPHTQRRTALTDENRLRRTLRDHPRDGTTRLALAKKLERQLRYHEALVEYREILSLEPVNTDARSSLDKILVTLYPKKRKPSEPPPTTRPPSESDE